MECLCWKWAFLCKVLNLVQFSKCVTVFYVQGTVCTAHTDESSRGSQTQWRALMKVHEANRHVTEIQGNVQGESLESRELAGGRVSVNVCWIRSRGGMGWWVQRRPSCPVGEAVSVCSEWGLCTLDHEEQAQSLPTCETAIKEGFYICTKTKRK